MLITLLHRTAICQSVAEVSLADLISSHSYLGVTTYWIDSNWKYRNSILQVNHVTENHDVANLRIEVEDAVRERRLEDETVSVCLTM